MEDTMKVQNYAAIMNAQYFKLETNETQAKISNSTDEFTDDTLEVEKIDSSTQNNVKNQEELSQKLSQALLQKIHGGSSRLVGDRVEITETQVEAQVLNFEVQAYIQADGKEMAISLDVNISRLFVQETKITQSLTEQLTDPLVINLKGMMPTLSDDTFFFDIDSDGEVDQISKLTSGNGFLVLDKNNNGKVDDGSELFGVKSGDGFKDLSQYDDDKNGWIDENDPIFNKLRIWQNTGENDTRLIALGEVGIGAIFLGNTGTPFSLKSDSNELLGEIRKSSFVVYENGHMGVISQVDLAVDDKTKDELEAVANLQKNILQVDVSKLYKNDEDKKGSTESKLDELKSELKVLEAKLRKASDEQKPSLQARIGLIFTQMMDILAQKVA